MAKKKIEATIGCISTIPESVYKRASFLLSDGMYVNTTLFPTPPEDKVDFGADTTALGIIIPEMKGNTQKTALAHAMTEALYEKIGNNLIYAKSIAKSDIDKINKSGFPPSAEPISHPVPEKAVIAAIVRGKDDNTVKVNLVKGKGDKKLKKEKRIYIVRVYATAVATDFTVGCTATSMFKLIVKNVPLDKAQFYAVVVQNAAGSSEPSGSLKFTLNG